MRVVRTGRVVVGSVLLAGCANWAAPAGTAPPAPAVTGTPAQVAPAGPPPSADVGPPPPAGVPAITARVTHIEYMHSYMVVEWPGGKSNVAMDRRELDRYRVGDEVVLDGALRPLFRR